MIQWKDLFSLMLQQILLRSPGEAAREGLEGHPKGVYQVRFPPLDFTLGGVRDNRSPVNKTRLTRPPRRPLQGFVMQRTGFLDKGALRWPARWKDELSKPINAQAKLFCQGEQVFRKGSNNPSFPPVLFDSLRQGFKDLVKLILGFLFSNLDTPSLRALEEQEKLVDPFGSR
jgi:hypothetical protein